MTFDLTSALRALYPNSAWSLVGDDYRTLEWNDPNIEKPTETLLRAEVARMEREWLETAYRRERAKHYPPITDQLDAIMKWLATETEFKVPPQLKSMAMTCMSVKARYPKPGEN